MAGRVGRVVIIVQENHTTDNYFRGLAPYGGAVVSDWPLTPNPPAKDPAHDRHAYFDWLTGAATGAHVQFDTRAVLPYYLYLALTGAFLENHCAGFGTNSTANHLLIVGGQSPTLKNPSARQPAPIWDMPSLPGLAGANGVAWRAYAASGDYPVGFYTQLKGSPNVVLLLAVPDRRQGRQAARARAPVAQQPSDEHPPANVTDGMDLIWQSVDAVVQAGGWEETVFMLTWDDWGGYDDHVKTPALEYTPDNVQLALGPRVPLLMFGGAVKPGIDSRWCSHVSIPKTAIQLLGLPPIGVPRLDNDAGLADLVDRGRPANPAPPAYGTTLEVPPIPAPPVAPRPAPPHPPGAPVPVGEIILRDGSTLPAPNDAPLPEQPHPPGA